MNTQLTTPEKLRLRSAFDRWMKNPVFFSEEIRSAQEALKNAEEKGWKLSVDRHGTPSANSPENMRLTPRELSRFKAKIATMSESEQASTRAAFSAITTRGFSASVDSRGRLIATAPKKCERSKEVSWEQKAKDHRRFWARHSNQSSFVQIPANAV